MVSYQSVDIVDDYAKTGKNTSIIGQRITDNSPLLNSTSIENVTFKMKLNSKTNDQNRVYARLFDSKGSVLHTFGYVPANSLTINDTPITFNSTYNSGIKLNDIIGIETDWTNGEVLIGQLDSDQSPFGYRIRGSQNKIINDPDKDIYFKVDYNSIPVEPVVIPDGFHEMPDGSIMADSDMYNFIIESDGLVRMFRIGATQYTEIKVKPENVTSYIDRNISRLLTEAERAIPYPRPEPIPEPTPEPTFCVNVYAIRDSGSVYSIGYPEITAAKVAELQQTQYVVFCNAATVPTEKQVQDFYGFTPVPPQVDTTINSTMVSQSVGAFILKDGKITGEILYIANQSFNSFYYNKPITSLVQIKSKSGVVIAIKSNNLNFTETQRDERITIDESAGNFKELLIDFFVWDSPTSQIIFSETKQIQIVDETDVAPTDPFDPKPPVTTCPPGYHKDFSGKCVADDPIGEIPKDRLIETLKGFLFGTVALSLLARKY
jgi:hypothetical protein